MFAIWMLCICSLLMTTAVAFRHSEGEQNLQEFVIQASSAGFQVEHTSTNDMDGIATPSQEEICVNNTLQAALQALPEGISAQNFLIPSARNAYASSKAFDILHGMPKGALLHVHSIAAGNFHDLAQVIKEGHQKVWVYEGESKPGPPDFLPIGAFKAITEQPGSDWRPANQLSLENIVELLTQPMAESAQLWTDFQQRWERVNGLMASAEFYFGMDGYLWKSLELLMQAGITYVEIKETLYVPFFMMDGTVLTNEQWMLMFIDLVSKFKKSHAGFVGAKIVLVTLKAFSPDPIPNMSFVPSVAENFRAAVALKDQFPDYVAGFDVAGEEDKLEYDVFQRIRDLQQEGDAAAQQKAARLPMIPHAGETIQKMMNRPADGQILKAIDLPHTVRIGHGFDVWVHPKAVPELIRRRIALEVCPISNQVLGYFPDLRRHYARDLFRAGVPMTINTDDPGMWHYADPTYDWLAATKAWGLDLMHLKKLALSSIVYSTLSDEGKRSYIQAWLKQWVSWIKSQL